MKNNVNVANLVKIGKKLSTFYIKYLILFISFYITWNIFFAGIYLEIVFKGILPRKFFFPEFYLEYFFYLENYILQKFYLEYFIYRNLPRIYFFTWKTFFPKFLPGNFFWRNLTSNNFSYLEIFLLPEFYLEYIF